MSVGSFSRSRICIGNRDYKNSIYSILDRRRVAILGIAKLWLLRSENHSRSQIVSRSESVLRYIVYCCAKQKSLKIISLNGLLLYQPGYILG